jgi:hypothetical protein
MAKRKPTVKQLQTILDKPDGYYETYVKADGSLGSRRRKKA